VPDGPTTSIGLGPDMVPSDTAPPAETLLAPGRRTAASLAADLQGKLAAFSTMSNADLRAEWRRLYPNPSSTTRTSWVSPFQARTSRTPGFRLTARDVTRSDRVLFRP
jgi:hypothetical protein